jgi:hypothetical protein
MDKMYSLMRLFVTESLTLLKQSDWDEELLARYNAIMKEYIFDANPTTRRNGIMLHVADVFIAELSKVEPNYYSTLSSGVLLALLEPFFYFGVHSDNVAFTNRVEEDVFEAMQNQWTEIIASLPAGAPETKTMEHHIERICENLYHYASTKYVNPLDRLYHRFLQVMENIQPMLHAVLTLFPTTDMQKKEYTFNTFFVNQIC